MALSYKDVSLKIEEKVMKDYFTSWKNDSPWYRWMNMATNDWTSPTLTTATDVTWSPGYGYDTGTTASNLTYAQNTHDLTTQTYTVAAPKVEVDVSDDLYARVKRFRAEVCVSEAMLAAAASAKKLGNAFEQLGPVIQAALENMIQRTMRGESPIIKDEDITYKPPPREFNPFLNASDQLEAFIKFVGTLGVRQSEVLSLPIDLFIKWLILEAAKRDDEPAPEDVVVIVEQPRCLGCQRWMKKCSESRRVPFCAPACLAMYSNRRSALQVAHG
jgi:hypothetical protein